MPSMDPERDPVRAAIYNPKEFRGRGAIGASRTTRVRRPGGIAAGVVIGLAVGVAAGAAIAGKGWQSIVIEAGRVAACINGGSDARPDDAGRR